MLRCASVEVCSAVQYSAVTPGTSEDEARHVVRAVLCSTQQ